MRDRVTSGLLSCSVVVASLVMTGGITSASAGAPRGPSELNAAAAAGVVVSSWHAARGVPSFIWAAGAGEAAGTIVPEQAARRHLDGLRRLYRSSPAALAGLRTVHVHDTGRGGIIVVLRPTVAGIDVIGSDVKVLMDRGLRLKAVAGAPHPAAHAGSAATFALDAAAGVSAAVQAAYGVHVPADRLVAKAARAGARTFEVAGAVPGLRFDRPARVRPVYVVEGEALRPAHRVELQVSRGPRAEQTAYAVVIDAEDGRVLERRDLVLHDSFSYRVWADPDGDHRPLDGPLEDFSPHPLGQPAGGPTTGVAPVLVSMEGFNTNPDGVADPWLPPGASETNGNNVDAYINHSGGEGFGGVDYRAIVTKPGVFDRTYDLLQEPLSSEEQGMAAITQLFYTTNWLHDWFYDSGFNESAGNAQRDNFGRGGVADDPMLALAQESAFDDFRDNAYMVTPEDGESPHMHMFLFTPISTELSLTVEPNNQVLMVGQAKFGPGIYDVTAELVVVDDGMGKSPTDGCEPPLNDLTGKIVLIDRGTCEFELKANLAEAAGAVGVIFPDILPDQPAYPPGPDYDTVDPTIPGQGLSKTDGDALKAQLMNGPLTAHMVGKTPPERDGTLDDMVVAHEWGHYIHNRLVLCTSYMCGAQGEGWGDFNALLMSLRPDEDLDGSFAAANYSGFDPTFYFGIRRVPYSTDFGKNGLTFRHITDGEPLPDDNATNDQFGAPNSEVHNAGEIWATMLWEVYTSLHKANAGNKSFDEVRRAMTDYMVAGMLMAPAAPTFTEQRDAILAAIAEADPVDFAAASAAFARRGAGTCAVSPPRDSFTFDGVMEDFEVRAVGTIASAAVDDMASTCDADGAVDVGETGRVAVDISNRGGADLAGATVTVTASSPSVVFTDATAVELDALAPLATQSLSFAFTVPDDLATVEFAEIEVTLTTPDGCQSETLRKLPVVLNGDPMAQSSSTDDVEAANTLWTAGGTGVEKVWSRQPNASSGQGWHAADATFTTDTFLASPKFTVSADEPLVIGFDHAHYFDALPDGDSFLNWDGGVVELSIDGGKTWSDVTNFSADPGYNGTMASSDNPLSNRDGYVRLNATYPQLEPVVLDFGDQFAGQEIRLRFRAGSDFLTGAPGWDIDNISFSGVTSTPFPGWVGDPGGDCPGPAPTTSDTDDPTSGSSSGAPDPGSSTTDAATTSSQTGADDGCACSSAPGQAGWQWLPWLALAGLRRRRR